MPANLNAEWKRGGHKFELGRSLRPDRRRGASFPEAFIGIELFGEPLRNSLFGRKILLRLTVGTKDKRE